MTKSAEHTKNTGVIQIPVLDWQMMDTAEITDMGFYFGFIDGRYILHSKKIVFPMLYLLTAARFMLTFLTGIVFHGGYLRCILFYSFPVY